MSVILKITDSNGNVVYVDNEGQVNGKVRVEGDNPLAAHLDHLLNIDIYLPFYGQRSVIDEKFLTKENGLTVLYKASDVYLKDHFIPVECTAFGYNVEILKE